MGALLFTRRHHKSHKFHILFSRILMKKLMTTCAYGALLVTLRPHCSVSKLDKILILYYCVYLFSVLTSESSLNLKTHILYVYLLQIFIRREILHEINTRLRNTISKKNSFKFPVHSANTVEI